jgi:hypothetical protein
MGWLHETHPSGSKQQYVTDLLQRNFNNRPGHCELLDHSLRGNHLWLLVRLNDPGAQPSIGLFLLRCHNGCWGYKGMSEEDSPYFYDCPLKFLEQAPEPRSFNLNHRDSGRSWRDFVREHHAALKQQRKRPRPAVGQKIRLDGERFPGYGGIYAVTADLGRKGLELNNYLRLSAHQIKWAELVGSPAPSSPSRPGDSRLVTMDSLRDPLHDIATKAAESYSSRFEELLRQSISSFLGNSNWTNEEVKDRVSLLELPAAAELTLRDTVIFVDAIPVARLVCTFSPSNFLKFDVLPAPGFQLPDTNHSAPAAAGGSDAS